MNLYHRLSPPLTTRHHLLTTRQPHLIRHHQLSILPAATQAAEAPAVIFEMQPVGWKWRGVELWLGSSHGGSPSECLTAHFEQKQ